MSGCWLVAGTDEFSEEGAGQGAAPPDGAASTSASTAASAGGAGTGGQGGQGGGVGQGGAVPVGCDGKQIVFVTSALYPVSGNLNGFNTVEKADEKCNALWELEHPQDPRQFVAWLSTQAVPAIDRLNPSGSWCTVTGALAFPSHGAVPQGPLVLLNIDESGVVPTNQTPKVWTGTTPDGTLSTHHCTNWTGAGSGVVGDMNNQPWTDDGAPRGCGLAARLYCFEQ
jgi:hypothetical protein